MKYLKLTCLAALLVALPASGNDREDFKAYSGHVRSAMMDCIKSNSTKKKTLCLNSLNYIRLQKQLNPWQNSEIKIMLEATEMAIVMQLAHIYLKDKNTQIFCDYAHTGGLLYRDVMSATETLIDSDPVAAEKMGPHMAGMRSIEKTLQSYKLTCLNARLPFDRR